MTTAMFHDASTGAGTSTSVNYKPALYDFVPLHLENRSHVSTAVMCRHLNRKEQTARWWACAETFPDGMRPLRVMGRLAWPVAGIRAVLGVAR